jgi:hypothetical protein
LVEVSEVDQDVVQAYVAQTRGYTAQNWMICERAPGEVCLPADRVLESVVEGYNDLSLLDCTEDDCEVIGAASQEESQECYTIALAPGGPGCTQGCAFARLPASPPGFRLDWVSALLIFLVAVMLGLFSILLVSRRRGAGEEIIEIPTPRGS